MTLEVAAGAGADADHEGAAAIAAQNGQGESVGVSSGVLQARAPLAALPSGCHGCPFSWMNNILINLMLINYVNKLC